MRFAWARTTIGAAIFLSMSMTIAAAPSARKASNKKEGRDWPIYGGTSQNNHFSPLTQINRSNVQQLTVAWTFDSEESGGLQTSPIVVGRILYGITPTQKIFAVDAATATLL